MGRIRKRKKNRYTSAQIAFVAKNIPGRSYADMTRLFNKRYGLSLSHTAMHSLITNHKLSNGFGHGNPTIPRERKYRDEHLNYLRKIVPGTPYKIVLKKFNEKFNFSISIQALRTICKRYKIQNGFTGCFPKGHIPSNKGKKGIYYAGAEKGWFKKGGKPPNTMPIGSERITVDGYTEVKISDKSGSPKKRWKGKHVIIWEKANGPVPKGCVVYFIDGNKENFKLSNLRMISRAELSVMNHIRHYSDNKDIAKAELVIAAVKVAISKRKQGTFNGVKKRLMIFINGTGRKVYVSHGKTKGKVRYYAVRENDYGIYRLRVKKLKTRATFKEAQSDLYEYGKKMGWRVL
jgi:hypothetical protein